MIDRVEVDLPGVARAAEACRLAGYDAATALAALLTGLTRAEVEAAAGDDDYGRQIKEGWSGSGAEDFPEFADAIASTLIARGDHMTACGRRAAATDGNAAQQLRAGDLGLIYTAEGWSAAPPPADEE